MSHREPYTPGPADATLTDKGDKNWAFVLVRQLRHSPEKVWKALTDPAQLREWAPFDSDGSLASEGATVRLSTVGTPLVSETKIVRAEFPHELEYTWGDSNLRWKLEDYGGGTRLSLWASIDRRYVAMGAAGWHLCLDVMGRFLDDRPMGRKVGPETMQFEGWRQLHAEYAKKFAATDS